MDLPHSRLLMVPFHGKFTFWSEEENQGKELCQWKLLLCSSRNHTHPMEGHWKFLGGGGLLKGKILDAKYVAKLEFPGGPGVQNKSPSVGGGGGGWIFSGIVHLHYIKVQINLLQP